MVPALFATGAAGWALLGRRAAERRRARAQPT
jgi:hypothetical protein